MNICWALLFVVAQSPRSPVVYRWQDAAGVSHYTDDLGTVPKNARLETVEAHELDTVQPDSDRSAKGRGQAPTQARPDGATEGPASGAERVRVVEARPPEEEWSRADEERWRSAFSTVKQKIVALEDEIEVDRKKIENSPITPILSCYAPYGGYAVEQGGPTNASGQSPGGTVNVQANTAPFPQGQAAVSLQFRAGVAPATSAPLQAGRHGAAPFVGPCIAVQHEIDIAKERLERNRLALKRAKLELDDLERRASLAAVPREWR